MDHAGRRMIDSREFAFPFFLCLRFCSAAAAERRPRPSARASVALRFPSFRRSVRKCQLSFFPFRPFFLSSFPSFFLPFYREMHFGSRTRGRPRPVVWKPLSACLYFWSGRKHEHMTSELLAGGGWVNQKNQSGQDKVSLMQVGRD